MTWASVRRGLCVAGLLSELLACGSPTATGEPSPIAGEDCRAPTASSAANVSQGSVQYVDLTVDGKLRNYRVFQPTSHNLSKPVPLVIALHGTPMNADDLATISRIDDEAAKAQFLAAYPNGCQGSWEYPDGGPKAPQVDFISQMISRLEAKFPIDKSRIFVVGVSAGSVMAYRLACDLSSQIAAVASVAGAMLPDDCSPGRPVSVLEMHGTADCWRGGCPHPELLGVDALIQRWRTIDGCSSNPTTSHGGITTTSLWHCRAGSVVQLDAIAGGHHNWFGCSTPPCNPVAGEPDATTAIWNFFSGLQET
jgi:polyhydroxybutyrate depolymerase